MSFFLKDPNMKLDSDKSDRSRCLDSIIKIQNLRVLFNNPCAHVSYNNTC